MIVVVVPAAVRRTITVVIRMGMCRVNMSRVIWSSAVRMIVIVCRHAFPLATGQRGLG
jgi:hypothetical protein